ncbi:Mrp,Iron-sulfur cluster carrier protein [Moritella yayanosii]|uniref:Iron-sulfur cluster carrier protein n=2 Tax=Moritella yayanosii TaxID=69539 RepID=A0A330LJK8_9GAMM|nr:Mrp,Iron-sulfur cluster carrier protein [Moritella yayanosii]
MHTTDHNQRQTPNASPQSAVSAERMPGIRHIIAVGSGKGGVGKSTVSVNLALALQQLGARVGIVDADILGPSIPGMLGIETDKPPLMTPDGKMIPALRHGLKVVSMAMLTGDDDPAVLRGPMVGKYLNMFVGGVQWGSLDYLILDLPPGTGDTQLTLAQSMPLSGVVIVTTPQAVSLKIARRGLRMFEKVQVNILGIIENMRTFTCPHCGENTDIFRHGGGEQMSKELDVPFLGALPLDIDVVTSGDEGRPIVADQPTSVSAKVYASIATALVEQLHEAVTVLKPFVWKWDSDEGAPGWMEDAARPAGSQKTPIGFLRRDPRTLSILWEDGHRDDFDVRDLRLACHCALCIEEMSGRKLLDPKTIRSDVSPRQIMSVGNYAITFDWSDGHNSGIYSFNDLRALGADAAARSVENV